MTNYLANNISTYMTTADFPKIGTIKLSEMETIPFYGFAYKNAKVMRNDPVMCKDFDGDCYKFVNKYLNITWFNAE